MKTDMESVNDPKKTPENNHLDIPKQESCSSFQASDVNNIDSLSVLFRKILTGENEALTELYQRLAQPLANVAERVLKGRAGGRHDAEDIVQSVFTSFWQRARDRKYDSTLNRNQIWKLLATITARKALNRIRQQQAQKRGGGEVRLATDLQRRDGEAFDLAEFAAVLPSQEFDLACEELLSRLDQDCRAVAVLKAMNHTNHEIADILQFTDRKVERKLEIIRRVWLISLDSENLT